ncbi:MAG: hypothetical protein U5K76_07870 [Woeseiaceae bacterium]|nr:hypothetical protein [Woeseiaceae bacterium]
MLLFSARMPRLHGAWECPGARLMTVFHSLLRFLPGAASAVGRLGRRTDELSGGFRHLFVAFSCGNGARC